MPKGGPPQPPPPPKGTNCPPTSYYWGNKQGCCVPRNPAPPNPPPPQCPKGWTWYPAVHRCHETPTPPSTPPPKPSHQPGHGYGDGNWGDHDGKHQKRSLKARSAPCPTGLDACPVSSLAGDYECLDTTTELESCGGCTSLGEGQDCTSIEGAWNVGCHQGSCVGKYLIFPLYATLSNRRFSVHMRWWFQNWRRWKVLRPGLILLVIFIAKKPTAPPPISTTYSRTFLFYFFQDNSRTLLPLIYPPVATKKGSAYLLLLFMVLFYGQGSAFRVLAYVFGSPSLYYLPPFWVTTYTLPGWRFCNFACDTYYSCCMLVVLRGIDVVPKKNYGQHGVDI